MKDHQSLADFAEATVGPLEPYQIRTIKLVDRTTPQQRRRQRALGLLQFAQSAGQIAGAVAGLRPKRIEVDWPHIAMDDHAFALVSCTCVNCGMTMLEGAQYGNRPRARGLWPVDVAVPRRTIGRPR